MIVHIHFVRPGKVTAVYTEGFVADDGHRLKTFSIVPEQFRLAWSQRYWKDGLLPAGRVIYSVAKVHFYDQWFTILKLRDEVGDWLGTYCDIATPLQKVDDEYRITDLFLDIWITPDGNLRELDWGEFAMASANGLLSLDFQEQAITTLGAHETAEGKFPSAYLS